MLRKPHDTLIRLRPRSDTLFVSQNRTVLATERDGFIRDGAAHGLLVHQTRLLSRYCYRINDQPPQPVALSNVDPHSWLGYYLAPTPGAASQGTGGRPGSPEAAQQAVEMRLSRYVGDGFHEDVDLTNFTRQPVSLRLSLEVDADFADQQETEQGQRQQNGDVRREWKEAGEAGWELSFDYKAQHVFDRQGNRGTARLHRGTTVRFEKAGSVPTWENGVVHFRVELLPRANWHVCVEVIPFIDGKALPSRSSCHSFGLARTIHDEKRQAFLREATTFSRPESETLGPVVIATLNQAKKDLAALRLFDMDQGERSWIMAAGIPIYVSLFGRDTLTAAWQAGLLGPDMMKGSLAELARRQGTEVNDWRDEEPGRMIHEAQTGPLAVLNTIPLGRYYGSITTSAFYPVVLSELWHWTGDRQAVLPWIEPALEGIRWLDRYSDLDGDGFYEYKSRSEQGVRNQAWKDSQDAIVDDNGEQVEAPIATCEEQGFVYMAKLHMSELLWWLGRKDEAKRLHHEANELKKRFNEAFWMDDDGFFALGLDSRKRPIRSLASNPGHCVATAIVDDALVKRTAGRLMADDLFSGWGVRTLSSRHPAYNPYSYHRGSVWPVEQGTFAMGFYRYGLHRQVELLARAQFDAAALFDFHRLPECLTGHPRDTDHPFPAIYPDACSPQAWSSSAVFNLLQAILGLYPYAPMKTLLVDPHLPDWLPEITLGNLRVGQAVATLRFYRKADGSSDTQVVDVRGPLHVVRQPSPWSLTASFAERVKDALVSVLPGR